ncbi:MAG: ADP-dependent NAD(P)H-hydrate dehydratase [Propionibacteriaceae bacterium]
MGLDVATPEAGVYGLATSDSGSVQGGDLSVLASELDHADAVVVGPGLDDAEATEQLLRCLLPLLGDRTLLVVDAFALGSLPRLGDQLDPLAGSLVLTPNDPEAELLLGRPLDDVAADSVQLGRRFQAVVACHDVIAEPDEGSWRIETGHSGLATNGSGDVLSGIVGGLLARGATPSQAACWGKYVHASAGERLAARVGRLGLAREILSELPAVLTELDA